jgi:hypothetical integral membrane protein (TIGR02206 family)
MRQFSPPHLAALATLVLVTVPWVWGVRCHPGPWMTPAARALALLIFVGWFGEYVADVIQGIWSIQYTLPLQLTDVISVTTIFALWTRRPALVELVYFWALSASLQATLTPDLADTFPSVFYFTYFIYHVGAITAACVLVFGYRIYPRRGAIWRVYGATFAFAVLPAVADVITGGNYMYLNYKPAHGSLLSVMGPWPWYIVGAAVIGLVMMLLLDAIARFVGRRDGVAVSSGRDQA